MIIDNIVHTFEPYEVTKDDIVILRSSSDTKTSFHFILFNDCKYNDVLHSFFFL